MGSRAARGEPRAGWAQMRERGVFFLMCGMFCAIRLLGRGLTAPAVRVTTLYFFVFGRGARRASMDYLRRVAAFFPDAAIQPGWRASYRHFIAFEAAILDKIDAWSGRLERADVDFEDRAALSAIGADGRGALVIGSHLGNLELCRALALRSASVRLNALVHTTHADAFNRVLRLAGASDVELIQVTHIDAPIALKLRERVARGEWVVIAGDRVPVHGARTVDVDFLGGRAALPIGPYVLASVLECPVHLLFCLRVSGRNRIYAEHFATKVDWSRGERDRVITAHSQRFASRLEHYLSLAPLQWFNFYPYWKTSCAPR